MDSLSQKMENVPIPRLVIKSSVPLMLSTLVSSLYNMVDSIFVSRLSEKALTAATIAFPLSLLLFAVSIGIGVGVNSRLSRFLGGGNVQDARETGWTGLVLAGLACIPFMLGTALLPELFGVLTDDPEVARMGYQYSFVILMFSLGQNYASLGGRLLQATGQANLSMATQLAGSVLNCVLDPIMIFGLLGCPAMGIRGAAIATVISQCVSGGTSVALYFIKNPELRLSRRNLRFRAGLAGEIGRVAVPTALTMAMSSVLMMVTNRVLQTVSGTAIAFYGIFSRLQSFLVMPVTGLSQGLIPVVGYFFGASHREDLRAAVRFAMHIALGTMAAGTALLVLAPGPLLGLFDPSPELLAIGRVGMRILSLTLAPQAVILIYSNAFIGMGNGAVNMCSSLLRGVLPVPLLLALLRTVGDAWYWFAFVLADAAAAVYAAASYRRKAVN